MHWSDNEPFVNPNALATYSYRNQLLRFMPSGFRTDRDFAALVYVRMKKSSTARYGHKTVVKAATDRWILFDAADREVLFTRDRHALDGDRPLNDLLKEKWDYAIVPGFGSQHSDDLPVDRFMVNHVAFTPETEPKWRSNKTFLTTNKLVSIDSAGFQLGYGALDFVNPEYLCNFYNENGDEGVVIDIPTRAVIQSSELIAETARIQNANGKFMSRHLRIDFRLGNVAHGISLKDMDAYRRIVENNSIDYAFLCYGGNSRFNVVEVLHRTFHIMLTGRRYEQYHMLGLATPPLIALLSYLIYALARTGDRRLITFDASSPIALSLSRRHYSQTAFYTPFDFVSYGERDGDVVMPGGHLPNTANAYPMNDPALNMIGPYQDYIRLWSADTIFPPLILANINYVSRYTTMMNTYAEQLDKKTFKELLMSQMKSSKHRHLCAVGIDYINAVIDGGANEKALASAFKHYSYYMPMFTGAPQLKSFPLIGDDLTEEAESPTRGAELLANIKQAIKNFNLFHKKGIAVDPRFRKTKREFTSTSSKPI